jgi:hypothetical protein
VTIADLRQIINKILHVDSSLIQTVIDDPFEGDLPALFSGRTGIPGHVTGS